MKLIGIALLLVLCLSQDTYNPGINYMMEDILVDEMTEVIVPKLMMLFEEMELPEIYEKHLLYSLRLYDMKAEVVPLLPEQIEISFDEVKNTMTIQVFDF